MSDLNETASHEATRAALEFKLAVDRWHERRIAKSVRHAWRAVRAFADAVRAQMDGDGRRFDA